MRGSRAFKLGCVQRRRHKATDIDLRIAPEEQTVRVDQPDLAIGIQPAKDLRTLGVRNAIDCQSVDRRLQEIHRLGDTNVEALPVQRQRGAGLVHRGDRCTCRPALTDGTRSGDHLSSKGGSSSRTAGQQRGCGECARSSRAGPLASSAGAFGNSHPGLLGLAPDKAVDAVHGAVALHRGDAFG